MREGVGTRLRAVRKELGLSLRAIADAVDVSLSTWQRLETTDNVPSGETLLKIAELGFNPGWILTGQGAKRLQKEMPSNEPRYLREDAAPYDAEPSGDHPKTQLLREDLLGHAAYLLEGFLSARNVYLAPMDKSRAITLLYQLLLKREQNGQAAMTLEEAGQYLQFMIA